MVVVWAISSRSAGFGARGQAPVGLQVPGRQGRGQGHALLVGPGQGQRPGQPEFGAADLLEDLDLPHLGSDRGRAASQVTAAGQ